MVFEREMLCELEEYFSKIDANQKRKQEEVEVLKALGRRLFHARKLLDDAATNAQKMVTQYSFLEIRLSSKCERTRVCWRVYELFLLIHTYTCSLSSTKTKLS